MGTSEPQTFKVEWTVNNDREAEELYEALGGASIGDVVGQFNVPDANVEVNHGCIVAEVALRSFNDQRQTLNIGDIEDEIAPGPFELESILTTEDVRDQDLQDIVITVVLE